MRFRLMGWNMEATACDSSVTVKAVRGATPGRTSTSQRTSSMAVLPTDAVTRHARTPPVSKIYSVSALPGMYR